MQRMSDGAEALIERIVRKHLLHSILKLWPILAKTNKFYRRAQTTIHSRSIFRQMLYAFEALRYLCQRSQRERYLTRYQEIMSKKQFSRMQKSLIKYWRKLVLKARSLKMKLEVRQYIYLGSDRTDCIQLQRVMQEYKRRSLSRFITDWQHAYRFDKNARVQLERKQRIALRNAWMSWKMEFESTR